MIANLFNTLLYQPFYNGFLFLVGIMPQGDVGLAIIALTITVKLVLFSLSYKSIQSQAKMKEIAPELESVKVKFHSDKKRQAEETFAIYRKYNINPLSTFVVILLQIPALLALYWVFLYSGLPDIDDELLYSFIPSPVTVKMDFLGLLNVTDKSIFVGVIAGFAQFLQTRLLMPSNKKKESDKKDEPSLKNDLMKSMQFQMKFMMPALIGFLAYSFGGAVGLYLITSSVFSIGQEIYVRRKSSGLMPSLDKAKI